METSAKKYLAIHFIFAVLFFAGAYFLINYYFVKQIQLRSFEGCLSVVGDPSANWITRKGTVGYCKEEVF